MLRFCETIKREVRRIIVWTKYFLCSKRLNLYLLMLEEIIKSFHSKGFKNFYNKSKDIPEREFNYLVQNYDLNGIDKVIVVGAGAIPYTAIFFAKQINKPTYIIEKNSLASLSCLNLIHRLNLKNIKVIKKAAQYYSGYANSLTIISLHTISKQKVFKQVLNYNRFNNIIIVRQPLEKSIKWYESISLTGLKYTAIKHSQELESIFLFNVT